jgi:hypothetical protein
VKGLCLHRQILTNVHLVVRTAVNCALTLLEVTAVVVIQDTWLKEVIAYKQVRPDVLSIVCLLAHTRY